MSRGFVGRFGAGSGAVCRASAQWSLTGGPHRLRRQISRGFTLAELMVVVVIMGVLATIGAQAFLSEMAEAKNTEALAMLKSISAAQEAFRDEHSVYLNVSSSTTSYYPPTQMKGGVQTFWGWTHPDAAKWQSLAPEAPHYVSYQYATVAGLPLSAPGALDPSIPAGRIQFPTASNIKDPWYVVIARGDSDHDGDYNYIVASSFGRQIFQLNPAE